MQDVPTTPTSIRFTEKGREALAKLLKFLRSTVPPGVKVNISEAVEYAVIEQAELIEMTEQERSKQDGKDSS